MTSEEINRSIELAKKFMTESTAQERAEMITDLDDYSNSGPTFEQYLDGFNRELSPVSLGCKYIIEIPDMREFIVRYRVGKIQKPPDRKYVSPRKKTLLKQQGLFLC